MARITETSYQSTSNSKSHSESTSRSESQSQSSTSKVLDEALRDRILSGLMGYMTDEEIDAYAEDLLAPQRDAELEAAQQKADTARLAGEQEIESWRLSWPKASRNKSAATHRARRMCRRRRWRGAWAEAATPWRRWPTRVTGFPAR